MNTKNQDDMLNLEEGVEDVSAPKKVVRKPKAKKETVVVSVAPLGNRILLRPIKWSHMGFRKPDLTAVVALRYRLGSGIEFDTSISNKQDGVPLESNTTTYFEELTPEYFQLTFYVTGQRISDFDTVALLGERGEVLYLYEF